MAFCEIDYKYEEACNGHLMYLVSKLSTVLFLLFPFGIIDEQTICSALTFVLENRPPKKVENQTTAVISHSTRWFSLKDIPFHLF